MKARSRRVIQRSYRSNSPATSARLKYSPQPRRYRSSRDTTARRLLPAVRRVSRRTSSRKRSSAFGVMYTLRCPFRATSRYPRKSTPLASVTSSVFDSLSHRIQQRLVRNFIEELLDVHVHDVDVAAPHLAVELTQGAERAAPRPKPVTVRRELRLKDRLQDLQHRLLDHPISYRRNPQRPLPPIRLRNQHPPHRLRSVGLRPKLDHQRRQIRLQLLPEGFHGDAIHPGLPTVAAHCLIRGSQPPQVQHPPHETVELPPLLIWRASSRAALLAFPRRDRRLSHGNLPRLRLSTQHRVAPVLPLLWTPFASRGSAFADPHAPRCRHAGRAALTTRRRYYEVPDFSLRTDRALRRGLIAQPSPPALRP